MQERDAAAPGAFAGNLIHQLVPGCSAAFHGSVEIWHPIADMVDPGSPLRQEPGDGTVRIPRAQEFNLRVSERERHDGRPVRDLGGMRHQSKDVTVEGKRGVEIRHRHANVGNTGCLGHHISGHETKTSAANAACG